MEERFGVYRAYYINRACNECTFIFGAIKDRYFNNHLDIYRSTIAKFENFCTYFVKSFLDIIKDYNQNYKNSFILTNNALLEAVIKQGYPEDEKLTNREQECLWWASKGKSTKQVAKILGISPATTETHNKNIRNKLHCSTMIEAVVEGIQRGMIGKINPEKTNKSNLNGFEIVDSMDTASQKIKDTNLALINNIKYS